MRRLLSTLILAGVVALPARGAAQGAALKWGPAPAVFPAGARMAVLQGDPGATGPITVRLDMPNGYVIPPHFHPTDEAVTVMQGTLLVGMGDRVDEAHAMKLTRDGFVVAPAQKHHFAVARGHTIVQVNLVGPFTMTYVNPADNPARKATGRR